MSDIPPQSDGNDGQDSPAQAPAPLKRKAIKPTQEEIQEREDLMYELLSRTILKSQIKKQFRKKYGDVSPRTIDRYLSRARARQLAEAGTSKDEMRAESRAFYEAMARDPQSDPRSKLIARERIDRLFGLDAPQKTALTDPSGDNPYVGLDKPELIRAIIARASAGGSGEDPALDGREGQGEDIGDQAGQVRGTDDEPQT